MGGSFCDENHKFDSTAFVESLGSAINAELESSRRRLAETATLQQITDASSTFFVVGATTSGCLFSMRETCLEVQFDTVDSSGLLTEFFREMELEGKFAGPPWNVQFMQGAATVDYVSNAAVYFWSITGSFLFVFMLILWYKMRKAGQRGGKRMSPDELDRYIQ